jgi:DNA-binding CsgD family transcriptional regulator
MAADAAGLAVRQLYRPWVSGHPGARLAEPLVTRRTAQISPEVIIWEPAERAARTLIGAPLRKSLHTPPGRQRTVPAQRAIKERLMTATSRARRSASITSTTTFPRASVMDPCGECLTSREREVLTLLCRRLTDREIGELLFISTRTVETHVGNILSKLEVANRRDAALVGASRGLPLDARRLGTSAISR